MEQRLIDIRVCKEVSLHFGMRAYERGLTKNKNRLTRPAELIMKYFVEGFFDGLYNRRKLPLKKPDFKERGSRKRLRLNDRLKSKLEVKAFDMGLIDNACHGSHVLYDLMKMYNKGKLDYFLPKLGKYE